MHLNKICTHANRFSYHFFVRNLESYVYVLFCTFHNTAEDDNASLPLIFNIIHIKIIYKFNYFHTNFLVI